MKKLDKEIERKGFKYVQYWRDNKFAIYEVYKGGKLRGYEVFSIPSHDGFEIAGNKIPPSETYPSDKTFGVTSYHCTTLERARVRLKELKEGS